MWVLENAEDRIEMYEPLGGSPGDEPTEMNLGLAGVIPQHAIPGPYNLEAMRLYYEGRRHVPLEYEPPKVGLMVSEEQVERPQLRGFDFE